jgi:hypothetical protein
MPQQSQARTVTELLADDGQIEVAAQQQAGATLQGHCGRYGEVGREGAGNRFQQPDVPICNENPHGPGLCIRAGGLLNESSLRWSPLFARRMQTDSVALFARGNRLNGAVFCNSFERGVMSAQLDRCRRLAAVAFLAALIENLWGGRPLCSVRFDLTVED